MRPLLVLLALTACTEPTDLTTDPAGLAPVDVGGAGTTGPAVETTGRTPNVTADAAFGVDDALGDPFDGHASDRILVGTYGPAPASLTVGTLKLERLTAFESLDGGVYLLPDGVSPADAVQAAQASGVVRYAELDAVRTASADPYRGYQWNLDTMKAETAWTTSTGAGVIVAVIDSGVKPGGADGFGSLLVGWDFVNGDGDATDDNGHGTHVAGTIAQRTNNGVGVAGLAPGASILPLKVLDATGSGYTSDTILALEYAVSHGADVVNLSLGGSTYVQSEADAFAAATNAGVFVAAATGNASATTIDYPAAYPGVVAVGATGYGSALAPYSNRGTGIDVVAPGGNTTVDANADGYGDGILQETFSGTTFNYYFYQGTSMATPHVAASAALLMAIGATNVQAESYLKSTAVDLGTAGYDTSYGSGEIRPAAALSAYVAATPRDADGDGSFTPADCNDANASIRPGAVEICGDGIDQDCSGADTTCPNLAPTAKPGGPYAATAGTAITVDGRASTDADGTIASWSWTFGDGTTGTGSTVSKTWSTAGTYTVTLTVKDNLGASASASTTVTVSAPTCAFSGSISTGTKLHTIGTLAAGTVNDKWLRWTTATANLDLALQTAAVGSTKWTQVASSASTKAGVAEHVVYTVPSKYAGYQFRWAVVRKSGSTSYCIGS